MDWLVAMFVKKVRDAPPQKKTGKCGNFEKTGGGSTQIPLLL